MATDLARAGARVSRTVPLLGKVPMPLGFRALSGPPKLLPLMGPQWWVLRAARWRREPLLLYCWDVWPRDLEQWADMLAAPEVVGALVSSTDGCRALQSVSSVAVRPLPEGMGSTRTPTGPVAPLTARAVDVLELGRLHPLWHRSVVGDLESDGAQHLYEARPGEIIFPTRTAMEAGLSEAKISVCFMRSETHPESAGAVRAMTLRYLESAAFGCLMLGSNPPDLVELFGYEPVVPVDWDEPAGQVRSILADLDPWQDLVDRNRARFAEVGSWLSRVPALEAAARSVLAG